MSAAEPLLAVSGLTKRFVDRHAVVDKLRRRPPATLTALDGVGFSLLPGETLGVVGESGSGKSTLARCIVRLHEPDAGSVMFEGTDMLSAAGAELRGLRRSIQMVFQDPYTSLNPRLRIGAAVAEPARVHGLIERGEEEDYATELLERVGIRPETVRRYPHEFSGGQRQRIAIARSLAVKPRLLIADEAVSALDVSIQAQLLSLLEQIRSDLGLTMIFIAHQLAVISRLADRVAIMYLGRIVETGATADVFANPRHPYTRALLEAHPRIDGTRVRKPAVRTETPSPYSIPSGCRFHTRCPLAEDVCSRVDPPAVEVPSLRGGHVSACHVLARAAEAHTPAAVGDVGG
ncbi:MAG: oligopeptide/dipeptide ABC transporter ATP-binding protein [Solirubrobacteraceae bacterium]|jgi:oligopeptide/dipeptide ABC transporter ATP-binding protein